MSGLCLEYKTSFSWLVWPYAYCLSDPGGKTESQHQLKSFVMCSGLVFYNFDLFKSAQSIVLFPQVLHRGKDYWFWCMDFHWPHFFLQDNIALCSQWEFGSQIIGYQFRIQ